MNVTLTVNGEARTVEGVRAHENLLHLLRARLGLTGAKNACEQGECGSCTVRMDGRAVCACLVPAGQAEGADVRTVESLAGEDRLAATQACFLRAGAVQCGFCTPGLLMSLGELLDDEPDPGEDVVRERIAGNLCRCTGYQKIVEAARLAASRPPGA